MTDFRALCAELTEFVARLTKHYYQPAELLTRARAALAEPEPEVAGELTDQELLRCANIGTPCYDLKGWERELRMMRAAIAADRARWGRQPAPPADGEVAECAAELLQRQALVPVSVHERLAIAAALRAAADQVVPEMRLEDVPGRFVNGCCHSQGQRIRSDLLAIAAELEGGK